MMIDCKRCSVFSCATQHAIALFRLLCAVVTVLAKRLPVALVPEQAVIALMWLYVIDDCCCCYFAERLAVFTQRVTAQEVCAGLFPFFIVTSGP